jgi:hypothetical protein
VGDSFARVLSSLRGAVDEAVTLVQRAAPSLAESAALAAVERMMLSKTFEFDAATRRRARALLPTMHKSIRASDWARFPGAPGRLPFLAASHSLLRARGNELLVIGLGTWKGRRSVVREVFVREGAKGSVGLPVSVQAQVRGHIEDMTDAEFLHVHNHPDGLARDIKNMLLGNAPVPSTSDRHVLLAHVEAAFQANTKGGQRRARFHLIENDRIHEYVLPPWHVLRPHVEQLLRALGVLR